MFYYHILFYCNVFSSIIISSILPYSVLFYFILIYPIILYSGAFYSFVFRSVLFYSVYLIVFWCILFYHILFYHIISTRFYFLLFHSDLLCSIVLCEQFVSCVNLELVHVAVGVLRQVGCLFNSLFHMIDHRVSDNLCKAQTKLLYHNPRKKSSHNLVKLCFMSSNYCIINLQTCYCFIISPVRPETNMNITCSNKNISVKDQQRVQ